MSLVPPASAPIGSGAVNVSGFPAMLGPYPNVQPFSYPEGLTFQRLFESYRNWLLTELVPHIDRQSDAMIAAYNAASAALAEAMVEFDIDADDARKYMDEAKAIVAKALEDTEAAVAEGKETLTATIAAGKIATDAATRVDAFASKQTVNIANYINTDTLFIDENSFSAAATAAGKGGSIFLPKRLTYRLAGPVVLNDINLLSDGALLKWTVDLGAGAYALTMSSDGSTSNQWLDKLDLRGPNETRALGVAPCQMHGLNIAGQCKPKLRDMMVSFFNRGITYTSFTGHIYMDKVNATNNYYGLYVSRNTSDYFANDSQFNGNTFAGIATPADQGLDGFRFENCHIGFEPYGIYQEATTESGNPNQGTPRVFLQDGLLEHCRFEAIGNGAIVSDAKNDASNRSSVNAVKINHPGFSWDSNGRYTLSDRDRNYAVSVGLLDRGFEIDSGAHPFLTGTLGVFKAKQVAGSAAIIEFGQNAARANWTFDSGTPGSFQVGAMPLVARAVKRYAGGQFYSAPGRRASVAIPNGYATYLPFRVDGTKKFAGIGVGITTAGNAGAVIRLGVYRPDGNGRPSTLVVDAGTVPADSIGDKRITGLSFELSDEWVMLCAAVQLAPTTAPVISCLADPVDSAPVINGGTTPFQLGSGWFVNNQGDAVLAAPPATPAAYANVAAVAISAA